MFWWFIAILIALGVLLVFSAMLSRRHHLADTAMTHRVLFTRALSDARRKRAEQALQNGLATSIVLRPLRLEEKERCQREWREIEARFSRDPARAVVQASRLAEQIAEMRGRRLIDTSARRVAFRCKRGKASREELQAALAQYREIIDDLLANGARAA